MSTHATDFDEGITGGVTLELTLSLVGGLVRADPLSDMKAPWRRPRSLAGDDRCTTIFTCGRQ